MSGAVQLPRPTLFGADLDVQVRSGDLQITETVQVGGGFRTGFVSQVRAAASSN